MQKLNLPPFNVSIEVIDGKNYIYDIVRRKLIFLTPEEWVRQNFLHFLINHHNYPKLLIKLETGLKYNYLNKRSDILVYDREGNPFLIVECKAAHIAISQKTLEQVTVYNTTVKARYIIVTNGMQHYCCEINHQDKSFTFLHTIPSL